MLMLTQRGKWGLVDMYDIKNTLMNWGFRIIEGWLALLIINLYYVKFDKPFGHVKWYDLDV